jgi:osmotically-inducible protein OsmY
MSLFKSVMIAGLVVIAPMVARPASAAPQTASPKVVVDDDTLEARVQASLKKSSMLAPRDIDVEAKSGVVTLTGNVKTSAEKARAAQLARVSGVSRVNNQLEIDPKVDESKIDKAGEKTKAGLSKAVDASVKVAQKTKEAVQKGVGKSEEGVAKVADKTSDAVGKAGDNLTDASVTTKVKANFSGESLLKDSAIDVDTSEHTVTLKGTVESSAAKARAVELARGTDGVTRVVDQLVVRGQ